MGKILILGGTEEARHLSEALHKAGAHFVTSLAGRVRAPAPYAGTLRSGGFGGEEGLARTITREHFSVLVDATHPFAATISPTAQRAAKRAGVPYLRLERRPWRRALGDRWIRVASLEAAAASIDRGARVLLTVGAGGLAPFLSRLDLALVARVIDPPDALAHPNITVVEGRGPFSVADERALFAEARPDVLVTKNSGGEAAAAKLVVARERRVTVVMVERPTSQPRPHETTVEGMIRRLRPHIAR